MTTMLQAFELTKRYENGVLGLDGLNLTIRAGEIYCLLGANGAGKTTTINLFLGFIPPTSGAAVVGGVDVAKEPLAARRHLAYVPENVLLYTYFTARQNLEFFARLAGRPLRGREQAYAVMRRAGLEEGAFERPLHTFSKGMRQKLGLAIAMVKQADVLLLDEPTSGLDPKAASEFLAVLRELRESGRAILMSTHDVFRSKEVADRVGIMRAGKLVAEQTREELRHQDLERLYLACMSEAPALGEPCVP